MELGRIVSAWVAGEKVCSRSRPVNRGNASFSWLAEAEALCNSQFADKTSVGSEEHGECLR